MTPNGFPKASSPKISSTVKNYYTNKAVQSSQVNSRKANLPKSCIICTILNSFRFWSRIWLDRTSDSLLTFATVTGTTRWRNLLPKLFLKNCLLQTKLNIVSKCKNYSYSLNLLFFYLWIRQEGIFELNARPFWYIPTSFSPSSAFHLYYNSSELNKISFTNKILYLQLYLDEARTWFVHSWPVTITIGSPTC